MRRATRTTRTAFTLIELLVVIGIIAVLIGLTAAGVMKLFGSAPRSATKVEIDQLNRAIARFYADHQCYPPSKIILKRFPAGSTATPVASTYQLDPVNYPLDVESWGYLNKIWPKLTFPAGGIAWDGTSSFTSATLDGDQCLVFFIGGVQSLTPGAVGCLGFSKSPSNPLQTGGDRQRHGFEFQGSRLYQRTAGVNFLSYKDAYGTAPYVYFSSNKGIGRYQNSHAITIGADTIAPFFKAGTNPVKYYNPDSCQIISAGADGRFGPGGGNWSNTAGYGSYTIGNDDQSNFHGELLGVTN